MTAGVAMPKFRVSNTSPGFNSISPSMARWIIFRASSTAAGCPMMVHLATSEPACWSTSTNAPVRSWILRMLAPALPYTAPMSLALSDMITPAHCFRSSLTASLAAKTCSAFPLNWRTVPPFSISSLAPVVFCNPRMVVKSLPKTMLTAERVLRSILSCVSPNTAFLQSVIASSTLSFGPETMTVPCSTLASSLTPSQRA
mmetsp:Transcript_13662/g.19105  ORF Transcript_13662/g.19105 Transcript_13662/m.19105 type:complete len:200 (+) Transcript_13662:474-1073(+)